jgi:hypothetical protein
VNQRAQYAVCGAEGKLGTLTALFNRRS